MFGFSLLLIALGGQTVSFSSPAGRLETLMPELSKATGRQLTVDAALVNEVVCIEASNVGTDTLLANVAYVSNGVWQSSPGGQTLAPDTKGIAQQRASIAATRLTQTKANLAELSHRPGPVGVALKSVLPAVDVQLIASTRLEVETVYSTRATPLQHALPSSAKGALDAMVKAHLRALRGATQASAVDKVDVLFRRCVFPHRGSAKRELGGGVGLEVEIDAYDARGIALESEALFQAEHHAAPTAVGDLKPLTRSARTKELLAVWPGPFKPNAAMLERLNHPTQFDPASWFGSVLCDYATAKGLAVVAAVPDEAITDVGSINPDELSGRFIESWIHDRGGVIEGGWLKVRHPVVNAENPDETWTTVDRTQLQALASNTADTASAPFWRVLDLLRNGYCPTVRLPQWTYAGLDDIVVDSPMQQLALLKDDQIRRLLSGDALALSSCPDRFRRFIVELLQTSPDFIETALRDYPTAVEHGYDRSKNLRGQVTEVLDTLDASKGNIFLASRGARGIWVARPRHGDYPDPFPVGAHAILAIVYEPSPGVCVVGPPFTYNGELPVKR